MGYYNLAQQQKSNTFATTTNRCIFFNCCLNQSKFEILSNWHRKANLQARIVTLHHIVQLLTLNCKKDRNCTVTKHFWMSLKIGEHFRVSFRGCGCITIITVPGAWMFFIIINTFYNRFCLNLPHSFSLCRCLHFGQFWNQDFCQEIISY